MSATEHSGVLQCAFQCGALKATSFLSGYSEPGSPAVKSSRSTERLGVAVHKQCQAKHGPDGERDAPDRLRKFQSLPQGHGQITGRVEFEPRCPVFKASFSLLKGVFGG